MRFGLLMTLLSYSTSDITRSLYPLPPHRSEIMLEVFGLAADIVSLVLGGFAIWLSWQFYDKSRTVDTSVQLALKGIETQTAALQTLSVKYMDRLTRFVTTPREESGQASQVLAMTLRELPDIVL